MATELKASIKGLDKLAKKLARLKRPVTRSEADSIGQSAVATMKEMISKGLSPISGPDIRQRFAPYKWASAKKSERSGKYPWSKMKQYPGKKVTPVNLKLSGGQLDDLAYEVKELAGGGTGVEIGYDDEQAIKQESGHREGVNGQASRPTIPVPKNGERFATKVEQAYLRILNAAIKKIIDS